MNTEGLLHQLEVAGVTVTHQGNDLRVRGGPGVRLAAHVEQIKAHKTALLVALELRAQIIVVATAAPEHFDRAAYDALWARWHEENGA